MPCRSKAHALELYENPEDFVVTSPQLNKFFNIIVSIIQQKSKTHFYIPSTFFVLYKNTKQI